VNELEQRLSALGPLVEFPPTPALGNAVERRLRRQRRLLVAAALAVVAVAVALAVPPARTALLRLFHIGSEEIRLVDTLPRARPLAQLDLGERLPLEDAQRVAGIRALVPDERPDAVYARPSELTLLYGTPDQVRLLVTERPPGQLPFVKKVLAQGTSIEPVIVGGHTGFWISGRPHVYEGRYVGNVLVYERGGRTIRLEGRLTKADALRVAASLRPVKNP
jgi:hypothetical protein